jgi:hypothetical protein
LFLRSSESFLRSLSLRNVAPPSRLWNGYSQRDSLSRAAQASPAPLRSRLHPKGVAGAPGAHQAPEPSRLGPEASSPVAAPGSATRAPSTRQKHRLTHQGITYSRGQLGLGVPCTPRHHPGMHIPRLAREAGLARGKDLDSNRGSRLVSSPTAPPGRGEPVG